MVQAIRGFKSHRHRQPSATSPQVTGLWGVAERDRPRASRLVRKPLPRTTARQPDGDHTEVTLDISRDNVRFGVRAVDTSGRHGLAGFPRPT
jgi:hypothetical protein